MEEIEHMDPETVDAADDGRVFEKAVEDQIVKMKTLPLQVVRDRQKSSENR